MRRLWPLLKFFASPLCRCDDFFFCCSLEFEWKIGHLRTCGPRLQDFFKCGPLCEHNCPPLDYDIGGVIPVVSSNTLLFLYLLGLQLLEVVAGKNRHWLIRSKYWLPSSELVGLYQTSESNSCSVNEQNYRYLHFLQLLVSEVLALLPLPHSLHFHYHPLTSQLKHFLGEQNNHSVAPHSSNFLNMFI